MPFFRPASLALAAMLAVLSPAKADTSAAATLAALETRLAGAPTLRFLTEIRAEGVIAAELKGEVDLRQGNRAWLSASGSFRGKNVEMQLRADRETFAGKIDQTEFKGTTPPALNDALTIELVRMGLLHPLAVLQDGKATDHGDGDVRDWVQIADAKLIADQLLDGRLTRPLQFAIEVGGKRTGQATLWIDLASGLPIRREQTVQFPEGEMRVVEQYFRFDLGKAKH